MAVVQVDNIPVFGSQPLNGAAPSCGHGQRTLPEDLSVFIWKGPRLLLCHGSPVLGAAGEEEISVLAASVCSSVFY